MAMATTATKRLRFLTSWYQRGYRSEVIDLALDKVWTLERERAQRECAELQARLDQLETDYQMTSSEFYSRFHQGELGDEADFFEWSALYEMYQAVSARLVELDSVTESFPDDCRPFVS